MKQGCGIKKIKDISEVQQKSNIWRMRLKYS